MNNKMDNKKHNLHYNMFNSAEIEMYDDVYDKVQNKLGTVYDIQDKFYVIMTYKGLVKCIKENCVNVSYDD